MDKILEAVLHSDNDVIFKARIINKVSKYVLSDESSTVQNSTLLHICLGNAWGFKNHCNIFPSMCNLLEALLSRGSLCRQHFTSNFETKFSDLSDICANLPSPLYTRLIYFFVPSWSCLEQICTTGSLVHDVPSLLSDICLWHLPLPDASIEILNLSLKLFLKKYSIILATDSKFSKEQVVPIVAFIANLEALIRDEKSKGISLKQVCDNMSRILFLLMSQNSECRNPFEEIFRASRPFIVDSSPSVYAPLASFLSELRVFYADDDDPGGYEKSVCFCIDKLVDDLVDIQMLRGTIVRVVAWSEWNFGDAYSCVDIWVIGLLSEFGHRNAASLCSNPQVLEQLLLPALEKTLEICHIVEFSSISLLNIATFLLLVITFMGFSNETFRRCHHLTCFLRSLISANDFTTSPHLEMVASVLCKSGLLLKMANSLSTTSPHIEMEDRNMKLFKLFDLFARKFPRQNIDAATTCLKAYSWKNLLSSGSHAGFVIQKSWEKWYEIDSKASSQHVDMLLSITASESRTIARLPGLRNKGNTCYANAAIQLLYHCSDFREALLTSSSRLEPASRSSSSPSRVEAVPTSVASPCTSLFPDSSLWQLKLTDTSAPEAYGLLRKTLTELFSTLSNAKTQAARDPSAVLTLSKPSHFIQGEQQDSAEYLNHLLDRLHEEELKSRRNIDESKQLPLEDWQIPENKPMEMEKFHSSERSTDIPADPPDLSTVRRLFGGKLSRRTICAQCKHVSSAELEDFICLFLPIESTVTECTKAHVEVQNDSGVVDIASLLQTHFSNSERITGAGECEACGMESTRERQLSLRYLPPHVLICLNVFAYSRTTRSCHKLNCRVRINEQLSVRVANSVGTSTRSSASLALSRSSSSSSCSTFYPPHNSSLESACSGLQSTHQLDKNVAESSTEMDVDSSDDQSHVYKLQGMILHHGVSLSCGHYTCAAKVDMNWVSFDDCTTGFTSLDQINRQQYATPYLLLYSKV